MIESRQNNFLLKTVAFLLLLFFTFVIYSNTFDASWHLDDLPNIINNDYLHLDSFYLKNIAQTFFTDPHNPEVLGDKPYRPVSCLTFAVNWYFGQDHVFGYHVVNILVHALTVFFLFLFIYNLFKTPRLKNYPGHPFFIALLSSFLWAVNPIQTQAVTYIVQRMAQLAALFYILGMFAYLKARMSGVLSKRFAWFLGCLVFYLLGVYSKPNAATLPVALALLEIAFFQDLSDRKVKKQIFFTISITAGLFLLLGSVAFLKSDPLSLDLYRTRTFTLSERLLTQPRVILFYLSQVFYPVSERLSIAHDVFCRSPCLPPGPPCRAF